MSDAIKKNPWIQLRMDDPSVAGVTVHPEDGDLFSLSKQMIARSGQFAHRIEALETQLTSLTAELAGWASQHSDAVSDVFLVLKGDHFQFLVVLKGTAHDGELEDDLTSLDLNVARNPDYDLINLSVLALPAFAEDVIRSFLPNHIKVEDFAEHAKRTEPSVASEPQPRLT